jgi:Ca2+-binding EF-hand superfamily protein
MEDILVENYDQSLALFRTADADGSGLVDPTELAWILAHIGLEVHSRKIQQVFETLEKGRVGGLNEGQFLECLADIRETEGFTPEQIEVFVNALDNFLEGVKLLSGSPGDAVDVDDAELGEQDMERLIQYLGYSGHDLQPILKEVDLDRSQTFSSEEFLKVMRILVLNEALAIEEVFRQQVEEDGTCPLDNPAMTRRIGKVTGIAVHEEKIRESIFTIGKGDRFFTLNQFKEFTDNLRQTNGFTNADYNFLASEFRRQDVDGSGAISVVELGDLLTSMAVHLSIQERQAVLAIVDLSGDGELDLPEFLRLVSLIRREETNTIMQIASDEATRADLDFDPGDLTSLCFPVEGFTKVLRALRLSDTALEEYSVTSQLLTKKPVWSIRELYAGVEVVRLYEMNQIRKHAGYSSGEVADLINKFEAVDRDRSGTIDMKELLVLLKETKMEPRSLKEQQRLKDFLELIRIPEKKNLAIDFTGFLQMMRFFNNKETERMLANEGIAAKMTQFSRREIEQYRRLFMTCAKDRGDELTVADTLDIFRSKGIYLSPSQVDELRETCHEITHQHDQENLENQRGSPSVRFDHFLILIHRLRSRNFAGIHAKLDI